MEIISDKEIPFNTKPRARYSLYINNKERYFFITTWRREEECLEIMLEKMKEKMTRVRQPFYVCKKENGERKILYKGSW